jgi:hypothetical protein
MGQAKRRKKLQVTHSHGAHGAGCHTEETDDDFFWQSDVQPALHLEKGVISIYGQQIGNSFINVLNGMAIALGHDHASGVIAALQSGVAAGTYLAYTLRHGDMRVIPIDPVADAASVIASGFLSSPYNKGDRTIIKAGLAPFGLGDEPRVHDLLIDEANRQRGKERFFASCIMTGMLESIGHFTAHATKCDHCLKRRPDLQLEVVRSVIRMMSLQFDHCADIRLDGVMA